VYLLSRRGIKAGIPLTSNILAERTVGWNNLYRAINETRINVLSKCPR
jgi:hypothetical protein